MDIYNGLGGYSEDGTPICHYINGKLICRSFCTHCCTTRIFLFEVINSLWKCSECSSFYDIDELKQ